MYLIYSSWKCKMISWVFFLLLPSTFLCITSLELKFIGDMESMWVIFLYSAMVKKCQCVLVRLEALYTGSTLPHADHSAVASPPPLRRKWGHNTPVSDHIPDTSHLSLPPLILCPSILSCLQSFLLIHPTVLFYPIYIWFLLHLSRHILTNISIRLLGWFCLLQPPRVSLRLHLHYSLLPIFQLSAFIGF